MTFLLKLIKWLFFLTGFGIFLGIVGFAGVYFYFASDLPKISSLNDYRPPIITSVYSDDNRKIAEFYEQQRILKPLSEMPDHLIHAFVAAEDARFYLHKGIDLHSIFRAFFKNLKAGAIVQGGSTITQQVTKSFLLTPERSYQRKIKEAILAYRIDRKFTKDQVLYLYLNQIYLGNGAYGVEAAAQNYYGKPAKAMSLAECAMLAGLPQAPSRYSPFKYPERAKKRQIYVLRRMAAEGYISEPEATEAINTTLDIRPRRNWYRENVPYYTEHVRQVLVEMFGREKVYNEGLEVYTCVNIEMQKMARAATQKGLIDLDKRQGYRGPLEHLLPGQIEAFSQTIEEQLMETPLQEERMTKGVVIQVNDHAGLSTVRMGNERGLVALKDMKWARKPDPEVDYFETTVRNPSKVLSVGDVIYVRVIKKSKGQQTWDLALEQIPKVESALLALEAETGEVKVMVGGRDFANSQFNRAIQSQRQPGSAFKPIIYAAALDKNFTPATVIVDSPIVFEDTAHDFTWKPKNYDKKFHGFTLFREGLIKSRNVITVKILWDIGIDYTINYARNMGITANLDRDLSLSLGSSGLSLLELVNAYSVFANQGNLISPCFIKKVVDRDGNVLMEYNLNPKPVIEDSTSYIITHLMEEVVKYGTGWRIKALKRPVAGKTGTTNNLNDAWFVGYTPRYITGVWVGFDHEQSLGKKETGSRAASPIWLDFMQQALEGQPVRVFKVPDSVVFAKIDTETGLLPIPESKNTIFECFKEGTAPTEYTKSPGAITEKDDFFKEGF
ncbi:MAG: PBP1A family penicillin-binding protein [Desulfobacteraceae bacterium]|nr:PBP1A family penicillin-binding protein [Desulfobacteraceae bacterium]MBC2757698.1 PBP1A family penicillin-binding protein [Desulfobacteraceae bacterium]